jgi:pilus assembly protein CpaC
LALAVAIAAGGNGLRAGAQQPEQAAPTPPALLKRVALTAGRSTVVLTDFDIARIAVTNPAVADAVVVQPHEILIDGKSPGTVSLIVWGSTQREQYDLVVEPGVPNLQRQLNILFPAEDIHVSASDEAVILSGQVSNNTVVLRAGEIAQASASKAKVINLLQLPGGSESQQVILQVRFAEVNRRALTELGANLFMTRPNAVGRSTTQQFAAPGLQNGQNPSDPQDLVFSDFLNLFFFQRTQGIGAVVKALKSRGFFQSLAEPNLIAYNNEEASFLAGGEIPVPVVQGATGTVTVQYKEFGIRLTFKPTIAGDVIRLKVRPEVSTLDFSNGVTLSGFRIPALSVRRAETDVELRDGQSFVVAGLLDNLTQENGAEIPLLSKLPIIGALFKSKADSTERTELMVLITPRLVQPLDPDEVPPLPTRPKRFLPPPAPEPGDDETGGGTVDAPAKNATTAKAKK